MRRLAFALALVALAGALAAGALGWLLGTQSGLRWAASLAGGGLATEGLRGKLAGEIAADRVVFSADGVRVDARDVRLRAHLAALLGGRLTLDPVEIRVLQVELSGGGGRPAAPPQLPLRLHVGNATVDRLELDRAGARTVLTEIVIDHARLGDDVSAAVALTWPDERFTTRARLRLAGTLERLEAQVEATVAGVGVQAQALLAPFTPERLPALEARFGPVDLARFFPAAPRTALRARLNAQSAPGGAYRGTLFVENETPGALDAGRLPLERLQAGFLTDLVSARLDSLVVALPRGGTFAGEAELRANRLQARLVAERVDLRALHGRLRRTSLFGPLQVDLQRERQRATLALTQVGIGLYAEVERVGDQVEVRELAAIAEGGELRGAGTVTLGPAPRFDAKAVVHDFDPSAFGDYPEGSLSGLVNAAGRLEPRDLALEWHLADSVLYGHTFASDGKARLVGFRVRDAAAEVHVGANRLTARGEYGRPGDELAVELEAPQLEAFTPASGSLRARGTLSGSLDSPRASLTGEARQLVLPGGLALDAARAAIGGTLEAHEIRLEAESSREALALSATLRGGWSASRGWRGQVVAGRNAGAFEATLAAPAPLVIAPQRVELGRAEARIEGGRVVVREATWSPGRLASSGEFAGVPAQWLIAAAGLGERASATLRLDGEWKFARAAQLDGVLSVRRAGGDVSIAGTALGIERVALEAAFRGGRASARGEIAAPLARIAIEGEVLPALALQGKVEFADLRTLGAALPAEMRVDGRLSAALRATGSLADPVLHGTLTGEALSFEHVPYGMRLGEGALVARLEGRTLRIESLSLRGGEGRFTAAGTLPLGATGTTSLRWRAERLTLLDRPDRRLVLSGGGHASYDGERLALGGELRADRGHFEFERDSLPSLGDDVVIVGRERPPRATSPLEAKLPLALDLRLDMGDALVVRGYGYDGKVAGRVELTTNKEGELRAYGRLHAVDATFLAYGQRLDVDPGVLIFDGPLDNPSLQITAWRRNQAVEAGVQMTGTARAPIVQLVSQPPVPEGERLSWLVLGRPPSGATQGDLGLLQAAAGALLAGGDSVPLDRRIARRFGLDELSLRGSGEAADRVVAIGKRLSDRLYVSYEQGLGAVASNLIKLDYALGRRWTLRAETGTSSGGGLFYRYSWD